MSLIWMRRGRPLENTVPATLRVKPVGGHGDLDIAFIDALLVAARFAHLDAAFLGDDGRIDHVHVGQAPA